MGRYRPPQPKSSPYITVEGYEKLDTELKALWKRRAIVVKILAEAAAEGEAVQAAGQGAPEAVGSPWDGMLGGSGYTMIAGFGFLHKWLVNSRRICFGLFFLWVPVIGRIVNL